MGSGETMGFRKKEYTQSNYSRKKSVAVQRGQTDTTNVPKSDEEESTKKGSEDE